MNLLWRFLWTWIFSRYRSPLTFFDVSQLSLHVLPTDCDLLWHMNNGRYFSLLDLGRIDYMQRTKLLPRLSAAGIYPVVASEMIRFRKSLKLFKQFDINTQIIGWDNKFFYLKQICKSEGEVCALALIKTCFLKKQTGVLMPNNVLATLGMDNKSPELPHWINDWNLADQDFFAAHKDF